MSLRHPLTGGLYALGEDGLVRVEEHGRTGLFHPDGRWHSGELRDADPHLVAWVGGPRPESRGPTGSSRAAPPAGRPGPPGASPGASQPRSASPGAGRRDATPRARETRRPAMELGLAGRKTLVTAASRGIGLAIARLLADEGADVALCARGEAALESAGKDLEARGVRAFTRSVDVSDGPALQQFVTAAADAFGGLDVLVCNASAGSGMGEAAWQASFDIDVMGAARAVEAALPRLSESAAASVIFISSTAALEYLGVPQPYNAMKAALITHANDLAQALAPRGIRVNVVSPGPIYFEGGSWQMIEQTMPRIYERTLAQCPGGRMGTPEEVARAVVFLASPAASWVTGANLVVDGGFTKRAPF